MSQTITEWNVKDLCYNPTSSFAIIILNASLSKIDFNWHVANLWRKASVRICVDGGTNEYHYHINQTGKIPMDKKSQVTFNGELKLKNVKSQSEFNEDGSSGRNDIPLPDIICGDFDSIEPDILRHYSELGVTITPTPDQDETDFTKALSVLGNYLRDYEIEISQVLVLASVNGLRFDHVMANVNTLFKMNKIFPKPVIMMIERTLLWLLSTGRHCIAVPKELVINKEFSWCGYMPFSEPVVVSTKGLKWDLSETTVSFGKLISTSNTYNTDAEEVSIDCSGPLLWTMGWDPFLDVSFEKGLHSAL